MKVCPLCYQKIRASERNQSIRQKRKSEEYDTNGSKVRHSKRAMSEQQYSPVKTKSGKQHLRRSLQIKLSECDEDQTVLVSLSEWSRLQVNVLRTCATDWCTSCPKDLVVTKTPDVDLQGRGSIQVTCNICAGSTVYKSQSVHRQVDICDAEFTERDVATTVAVICSSCMEDDCRKIVAAATTTPISNHRFFIRY